MVLAILLWIAQAKLFRSPITAGSVAVLPIKNGGARAPSSSIQHVGKSVTDRQTGPHAHNVQVDKENRFALVADLGLDEVLVYRFNPDDGKIVANDPPAGRVAPGAGPRHPAIHPSGKYVYAINELNSTVTAFRYDQKAGTLSELQTLTTLQ